MRTGKFLIIIVLLAVIPVMEPCTGVFGQGLFNNNSPAENTGGGSGSGNRGSGDSDGTGNGLRAGGTENPGDGGQASKVSPVRDGWAVLLTAGIIYGLYIAKRRKR